MMIASVYVFKRYRQEKTSNMMNSMDNDGYDIMPNMNNREMTVQNSD